MTQRKSGISRADVNITLLQDDDFLRPLIVQVVQEVLEVEMESLQAGKSDRTTSRPSYRSGCYSHCLVSRIGKLELRAPQDRQ